MKVFIPVFLVLAAVAPFASGANPGDEAIVVYNSRLPDSKAVAQYYAEKRHVPPAQVFGFDLTTNEAISRLEFRTALQEPLAKAIAEKKLWRIASHIVPATNNHPAQVIWQPVEASIRYAVLCYGVPLKIEPDPNLKEEGMEKLRPEMRHNEAAVDSELALLPMLQQALPLSGPLRNPVFTATNAAFFHPTNGLLLVARLDGPTVASARGLVDKALAAEENGLWGRAYFDLRNTTEPGLKLGDDWLRTASQICRRLGFETVVDENPATFPAGFPMSQIAIYAGWYETDVSGPFARPTVEFMPGAFAYHLHSFSARTVRDTTHGWAGAFIAKGAAATMGCVYEPYLTGTPEIAVFISRLVFFGFTFGEAAYASQPVLSWQTAVIGDPLYRPFGGNPELLQDKLIQHHDKLAEWAYLRLINVNLVIGKSAADCCAFLEQLNATKQSAVLSEKLGDLCLAQGKPSSAVHAYAEALKLDPTPQQRLRLLLVLGDKLASLDRASEAYDAWQRILQDFPDYPDKLDLYRKLLPLAHQLHRDQDAAVYQKALQPPEIQIKLPAASSAPGPQTKSEGK